MLCFALTTNSHCYLFPEGKKKKEEKKKKEGNNVRGATSIGGRSQRRSILRPSITSSSIGTRTIGEEKERRDRGTHSSTTVRLSIRIKERERKGGGRKKKGRASIFCFKRRRHSRRLFAEPSNNLKGGRRGKKGGSENVFVTIYDGGARTPS